MGTLKSKKKGNFYSPNMTTMENKDTPIKDQLSYKEKDYLSEVKEGRHVPHPLCLKVMSPMTPTR